MNKRIVGFKRFAEELIEGFDLKRVKRETQGNRDIAGVIFSCLELTSQAAIATGNSIMSNIAICTTFSRMAQGIAGEIGAATMEHATKLITNIKTSVCETANSGLLMNASDVPICADLRDSHLQTICFGVVAVGATYKFLHKMRSAIHNDAQPNISESLQNEAVVHPEDEDGFENGDV